MTVTLTTNMDFDRAWQLYLATADLNGTHFDKKAMRSVPNLMDVVDYDVLLLDGFGVLNLAGAAIPGMINTIDQLTANGKGAYVLTNGASVTKDTIVKKYDKFGYRQFNEHTIVTSRDALIDALKQYDSTMHWGLSPASGDNSDIGVEFTYLNELDDWESVDGFILASTLEWDDEYTDKLYATLKAKPRLVLCANPDITAPTEYGFTTEPGYYARHCATIEGVKVRYYGKPDLNVYNYALSRIRSDYPAIEPQRILMVGDSPHTDVLGGKRAGMKTALMADWGLFASHEVEPLLDEAHIYPDWLITER